MIGIYKITNLINQHSYIGQSVQIEKRWLRHQKDAFDKTSKSYNYPLYQAIRKYGLEYFNFEVLELCDQAQLNQREIYWIEYYDTYINGYNQTLGGQSPTYKKITPELLDIITKELQNNSLIKHADLAAKYNVSIEMIQGINTGRYWHRDLSYPLQDPSINKNTQQKVKHYYCKICGKEVTRGKELCSKCVRKQFRKVERPPREQLLEEIATSSFVAVGNKYGVTDNAIRKWCIAYGLPTKKKEIKELYNSLKR